MTGLLYKPAVAVIPTNKEGTMVSWQRLVAILVGGGVLAFIGYRLGLHGSGGLAGMLESDQDRANAARLYALLGGAVGALLGLFVSPAGRGKA